MTHAHDATPIDCATIIAAAMKLVASVEFDVNGAAGKGGHGGLTSNETIRAAGELRVIISGLGATHPEGRA